MNTDALDLITPDDCLLENVDPIKTGREISLWVFMKYDIGPEYNETIVNIAVKWVENVFKTYFRKHLRWDLTFSRLTRNTKEEVTMLSTVYDFELTPNMVIDTLCRLFAEYRSGTILNLPYRPEKIRVAINEAAYGIKWEDLMDCKRGPFYIWEALPPMQNWWSDVFQSWYRKHLYDAHQLIGVIEESKNYRVTSVRCEFANKHLSREAVQNVHYDLVMLEPLLNVHDRTWNTRMIFDEKLTEQVEQNLFSKPTREAFTVFGYDNMNNLFMRPGVFLGYISNEKRSALCYIVFEDSLADFSTEQRIDAISKYFV